MLDAVVRRLAMPVDAKAEVVRPCKQNGRPPSVSVFIPCYNYGHYLTQCVNSVLDQKGVRVDILIIDDASSDGSDQIVRQLGVQDSRIRTICHTVNQGNVATCNEGIAQCIGDYSVLLSADDLLTPGCLERAIALMEEYPSVGFTYGSAIEFTDANIPPARTTARSWIIWQGRDWLMQRCKTGENAVKSPEVVIRTSLIQKIGGLRADLPHAADFEFWMRAAVVSDVGYVAGADQAYYRIHANNMNHAKFSILDDFSQRLNAFDAVFRERSCFLEDPYSMSETAHRALAQSALNQGIRDTAHRALARSVFSRAVGSYSHRAIRDEPAGTYSAFALKAWPDARQLSEWRILDKLSNENDRPPRLSLSLITRMAVRKTRTRFNIWRRKLTGV
jgi:glycosyltransferase involved in cell wall biosynthesis